LLAGEQLAGEDTPPERWCVETHTKTSEALLRWACPLQNKKKTGLFWSGLVGEGTRQGGFCALAGEDTCQDFARLWQKPSYPQCHIEPVEMIKY
jgi:hypothetical protein